MTIRLGLAQRHQGVRVARHLVLHQGSAIAIGLGDVAVGAPADLFGGVVIVISTRRCSNVTSPSETGEDARDGRR